MQQLPGYGSRYFAVSYQEMITHVDITHWGTDSNVNKILHNVEWY
jgi:hypothetical protein